MKKALHFGIVLSSFALAMLLASCGGGSGSSSDLDSSTVQSSGTVGVLLTDSPADLSLFASINATIESVELLGAEDEERISIYSGPAKTFDLLRLRNEAIPFTFKDDVPTGTYCKVRLTLSDLELVLADGTQNKEDNEIYHPHLPGNGKLDLVARDCFDVGAGEVVTLQVDIDAGKSIQIQKNGAGYNFRPVVFVDVLNEEFVPKLVRIEGEITEIDEADKTLLVCGAVPAPFADSLACVEVSIGEDSAFFDNVEYGGAPQPLDTLFSKTGENVTVVGRPQHDVDPYLHVEVPEGHYPPPGECKLWDINTAPGQQPAPMNCDDIPETLSEDTVIVDHDGVRTGSRHAYMKVAALVIELGEFLQLDGAVADDADAMGFPMEIMPGQEVASETPLPVLFYENPEGGKGTRIVAKTGELLDYADVNALLMVQADGALDIDGDVLNAALVVVDTDSAKAKQVTGTILEAFDDLLILDSDAVSPCGGSAEELVISYSTETEILSVIITDLNTDIAPGGTLEEGLAVGVTGRCEQTGYIADSIVILDDQREK